MFQKEQGGVLHNLREQLKTISAIMLQKEQGRVQLNISPRNTSCAQEIGTLDSELAWDVLAAIPYRQRQRTELLKHDT